MKKLLILAGFIFLTSLHAQTGNTGINTTAPKATLDVSLPSNYTNGQLAGVAIPQLTGDQIEAMSAATPKVGTIVYATAVSTATTKDVTAVGYWYWKDATDKWEPFTLGTSAAGNTVDWSVNGNSGTTAANYLGTTDNQPLNFKTNATTDTNPKMTILPNGNVGIGTTAPALKFHVKTGSILAEGGSVNSNNIGRTDNWSGFGATSYKQPGLPGTNTFFMFRSNGDATTPAYVSNNDVLGMVQAQDLLSWRENNAINGPGNGANISFISRADYTASNKPTAMTFNITKPNSLAYSESMRIDENGNIGIGTAAPIEKLDVAGNIKSTNLAGTGNRTVVADANGVLRVGSDANNNTGWSLTGNTGTTPTSNYLGTTDNQPLNFKTNSTADSNPKMTILPNGNVGVGTSNPTGILHLAYDGGAKFGLSDDMVIQRTHSNGDWAPISFLHARGTIAAPQPLQKGDQLGLLLDHAYLSNGSWINALNYLKTVYEGDGTNNLSSLYIGTSGIGRMKIDENGNIGVATSNPLAKLHIDGAADNPATGAPTAAQQANDVVVTSAGNVGIGLINPAAKVEVVGNIAFSNKATGVKAYFNYYDSDEPTYYDREFGFSSDAATASDVDRTSIFIGPSVAGQFMNRGRIQMSGRFLEVNGSVTIGTSGVLPPTERLEVAGNIRATGVFKSSTSASITYPDYVFQKYYNGSSSLKPSYSFLSLDQVEKFVKTNGHLPGYKSAAEVEKEGSIDITTNTLTNQEKIEELYLHTIEQDKKLKEQDKQIATQQQTINELMKRLEALEKK